jgi:replication initiation protein RepC
MVMGEAEAAVVVACLLQRSSTIQSAGGYLRELTRKAGEGEFSLGPVLMAQINAGNRERRSPDGHGWLTVLRVGVLVSD